MKQRKLFKWSCPKQPRDVNYKNIKNILIFSNKIPQNVTSTWVQLTCVWKLFRKAVFPQVEWKIERRNISDVMYIPSRTHFSQHVFFFISLLQNIIWNTHIDEHRAIDQVQDCNNFSLSNFFEWKFFFANKIKSRAKIWNARIFLSLSRIFHGRAKKSFVWEKKIIMFDCQYK
jgi:hypothetical protein